MTPEQFNAIEKFALDLKECYNQRLKECQSDNLIDKAQKVILNYAINILNLHLQLSEIDVNRELCKMAKEFANGK